MNDDFDYDNTPSSPSDALVRGDNPYALTPEELAAVALRPGDVIEWEHVPSGALVRKDCDDDEVGSVDYLVRHHDGGWTVGSCGVPGLEDSWVTFGEVHGRRGVHLAPWDWNGGDGGLVQIVAVNLTGRETAADLQQLAEAFETSRGA